uniref:Uncharacterized protein n=1 Tax=Plectus sambesii TaxID=2011161 RepID=A0A914WQD4_9BILA
MIGYLYAIANGAEWIYDTDDDNQPIEKGLGQFDLKTGHVSGISYGEEALQSENFRNLFNPYSFFGQPGMWPRGYPLDNLNQENNNSSYFLCKKQKIPAIQQGLVRKDPDVDAIYRLLYADKDKGLEVHSEYCLRK